MTSASRSLLAVAGTIIVVSSARSVEGMMPDHPLRNHSGGHGSHSRLGLGDHTLPPFLKPLASILPSYHTCLRLTVQAVSSGVLRLQIESSFRGRVGLPAGHCPSSHFNCHIRLSLRPHVPLKADRGLCRRDRGCRVRLILPHALYYIISLMRSQIEALEVCEFSISYFVFRWLLLHSLSGSTRAGTYAWGTP